MVATPKLYVLSSPYRIGGEALERLWEIGALGVADGGMARYAEELGDLGDAGKSRAFQRSTTLTTASVDDFE